MLLFFEESLVQVYGLDELVIQLQELTPCNIDEISWSWVTPRTSGIHSPSPADAMSSVSTETFMALSCVSLLKCPLSCVEPYEIARDKCCMAGYYQLEAQ